MKALFFLLLIYANMGFTVVSDPSQKTGALIPPTPLEKAQNGYIIVSSPDDCRIVLY